MENGILILRTPFGDAHITKICRSVEAANKYLEAHPVEAAIAEYDGLVLIAKRRGTA